MSLIGGKVLIDAPMRWFTSMKVGGPADDLFFPGNVDEVKRILLHARKEKIPLLILGKGTNLIVRDKGIRGWVVSLTEGMSKMRADQDVLEAEAGASLERLVQFSASQGLTGMEAFHGIPGTVGGALVMNAGAWGMEMKDVTCAVSFLNEEGELVEHCAPALKFSYRKLDFPPSWIILRGRFRLKRGMKEEILQRMEFYGQKRRDTQPLDRPSAGSIFKNPKEGPAGKWIEQSGLKGFRMGEAMVSDRHANFIVNLGNATATEVTGLMEWVEKRVYEEKGIHLEREVKVVGENGG